MSDHNYRKPVVGDRFERNGETIVVESVNTDEGIVRFSHQGNGSVVCSIERYAVLAERTMERGAEFTRP